MEEVIGKDTIFIGITGYSFLNEYIEYGLDLPSIYKNEPFEEYLTRKLLPRIRKKLKKDNLIEIDNNIGDIESRFLLIHNDKIYIVYSDLTFGIVEEDYCCLGSGEEVALGVLYALKDNDNGYNKCKIAVEACDYHTCYVDGNMQYMKVKNNKIIEKKITTGGGYD